MMTAQSLAPFQLLPAKPGTCPQCAVEHAPEMPHNQQSMFWLYWFYNENGRWPTWKDAMAQCTDEMKAHWTRELNKMGVEWPE